MSFEELFGTSRFWTDTLIVLSSVLLVIIIHWFIYRILRYIMKRDWRAEEIEVIILKTKGPSLLILFSLGIIISLYFTQFSKNILSFIWHILQIIGTFSIAWMVIALLKTVRIITLHRFDLQAEDNLRARKEHTRFRIIERVLMKMEILPDQVT